MDDPWFEVLKTWDAPEEFHEERALWLLSVPRSERDSAKLQRLHCVLEALGHISIGKDRWRKCPVTITNEQAAESEVLPPRDPRVNPQRGDVLRRPDGAVFIVTHVDTKWIAYEGRGSCLLADWPEYMRDAVVIGLESHLAGPVSPQDPWLQVIRSWVPPKEFITDAALVQVGGDDFGNNARRRMAGVLCLCGYAQAKNRDGVKVWVNPSMVMATRRGMA